MKSPGALMVLVSLAVLSGCTASPVDEELSAVTTDALSTTNGLGSNGLGSNGLGSNGLGSNGLGSNGLGSNGLGSNNLRPDLLAAVQDPGTNGAAARAFIRHAVACALKPTQSFAFTWTDNDGVSHQEEFVGELGIAPSWATKSLNQADQQMVSGCLAAHVNFYGVPVIISLRSGQYPLRLRPWDPELDDYSNVEGAFWGNLWADQPHIYTCYNEDNVANSRAHLRDCAAGHVASDGSTQECGIIEIVGSCDDVCAEYNHNSGYYAKCKATRHGKSSKYVITTALP